MGTTDYIVIGVILLVIGAATAYIIRAKKRGQKCIGCPYSSSCGKSGGCSCGCGEDRSDSGDNTEK